MKFFFFNNVYWVLNLTYIWSFLSTQLSRNANQIEMKKTTKSIYKLRLSYKTVAFNALFHFETTFISPVIELRDNFVHLTPHKNFSNYWESSCENCLEVFIFLSFKIIISQNIFQSEKNIFVFFRFSDHFWTMPKNSVRKLQKYWFEFLIEYSNSFAKILKINEMFVLDLYSYP